MKYGNVILVIGNIRSFDFVGAISSNIFVPAGTLKGICSTTPNCIFSISTFCQRKPITSLMRKPYSPPRTTGISHSVPITLLINCRTFFITREKNEAVVFLFRNRIAEGVIKLRFFKKMAVSKGVSPCLFPFFMLYLISDCQKSLHPPTGYYSHQYEHTYHLIEPNKSTHARLNSFSRTFLRFLKCFSRNPSESSAVFNFRLLRVYERGSHHPLSRLRKEVNTMNEPVRTQWQIRCAFNGYCKRTLKNEAANAHKHKRVYFVHGVLFRHHAD